MKDAETKKEQRADELLNKGAALYQKHQYAEAMTYYQQAAELGSVTAMSNLGYCYYYGRSVPVDYQQAAHYFQQAAAQGDANSLYKLGDMLAKKQIPETDCSILDYYTLAYEQARQGKDIWNYPDICLRLARYTKLHKAFLLQEAMEYFQRRIDEGDQFTAGTLKSARAEWQKLPFKERLSPLRGTDFRLLNEHVLYVEAPEDLKALVRAKNWVQKYTGFLAYVTIDPEKGIEFYPLFQASFLDDHHFDLHTIATEDNFVIGIGGLQKSSFFTTSVAEADIGLFQDFINFLQNSHKLKSKGKQVLRDLGFLDHFRYYSHPDDLEVILVKENLEPEQVWVRALRIVGNKITGKLLLTPDQDFGVKEGDKISFGFEHTLEGEVILVSPQDKITIAKKD
jgi:hypothetical protein